MATIVNSVDVAFTPATSPFMVQVSNGKARLERRQTSGSPWVVVAELDNTGLNVDNFVVGVQYKFSAMAGTPSVQADQ